MENSERSLKWNYVSLISSSVVLLLCIAWTFVAMLNGSFVLENSLPINMFAYDGWMIYIFIPFAVIGVLFGIFCVFHGLFYSKKELKTYEVSLDTGEVHETLDGCFVKLFAIFVMPVICGWMGYAIGYYLVYIVVEFSVMLLPYIIGGLLLVIAVVFAIFSWNRMEDMKLSMFITMQVLISAVYIGLAIFLSGNVNVGGIVADKITEMATTKEVRPKNFTLSPTGAGGLRVGQTFTDMSDSDEGLYNRVEKNKRDWDGDTYYDVNLYWDDENVATISYCSASPVPEYVMFYSNRVTLPQGIKTGMPVREAIKKGLKFYVHEDAAGVTDTGYYAEMTVGVDYECNYLMGISPEMFTDSAWTRIMKEIASNVAVMCSEEVRPEDIANDNLVIENIVVGECKLEFW